jgi:hypothetical protein
VAGDDDAVEAERVEQREEIPLVIGVAVRVAMRTEAVPAEVERDDTQIAQQRDDAKPVGRVAGQAVQQNDGWAVSRGDVSQALRAAILRSGSPPAAIARPDFRDWPLPGVETFRLRHERGAWLIVTRGLQRTDRSSETAEGRFTRKRRASRAVRRAHQSVEATGCHYCRSEGLRRGATVTDRA